LHCCELLPLEELKSVLRHCHLGVITYGMKGLNNQYCAPNKLFEYAQSFLPMLTTAQETFKQVFKEHPIGQVIPESDWRNNDNKAVANIILDMLDNPPSAEFFENFNREFIWEKESKRFILALEKYVV